MPYVTGQPRAIDLRTHQTDKCRFGVVSVLFSLIAKTWLRASSRLSQFLDSAIRSLSLLTARWHSVAREFDGTLRSSAAHRLPLYRYSTTSGLTRPFHSCSAHALGHEEEGDTPCLSEEGYAGLGC